MTRSALFVLGALGNLLQKLQFARVILKIEWVLVEKLKAQSTKHSV